MQMSNREAYNLPGDRFSVLALGVVCALFFLPIIILSNISPLVKCAVGAPENRCFF